MIAQTKDDTSLKPHVDEIVRGLLLPQKELSSRFFYDKRGSELFDAITDLPEYYPTRTEIGILEAHGASMADCVGPGAQFVEYGSGSSRKTRLLLDRLDRPAEYVPMDISREHLLESCQALRAEYPAMTITPVVGDYTKPFELPPLRGKRRVFFFPGSTIGNLHAETAVALFERTRLMAGPGGGFLIGADLRKDVKVLEAAYNDAQGLTADFNLNVLDRMNRELGANFDREGFAHSAFYRVPAHRMEMHLVSRRHQTVRVAGVPILFAEGETIHTECCYKYTIESLQALGHQAGFRAEKVWTDERQWFSVHYFSC